MKEENAPATSTPEFQAFLKARRMLPVIQREECAGGFTYTLNDGCLVVKGDQGDECWRSSDQWWVEDFCIGDVEGSGRDDFLFTLYKSWSYYGKPPRGVEADSPEVRCHLFLYSMRSYEGRPVVKALWCSSNLQRPILDFFLDTGGRCTPVASGMLLRTLEGVYDEKDATPTEHTYAWQRWGFTDVN